MSQQLYSGGWKTSDHNSFTTLTAVPLEQPKVFRISCTELVDSNYVNFRVHVDGKQILTPMTEGSSILVEGRSVFLEQISPGVNISAVWNVVQEPSLEFVQATWSIFPQDRAEALVCAFDEEQEFVLGFNRESQGCRSGLFTVTIDGNAVMDLSGATLRFLEGSSFIGRGKIVSVHASGQCDNHNSFRGSIKIGKYKTGSI